MNPLITELRQRAMALPMEPGVYLMKDADGRIIYVGKAKKLKNRVSQYFGSDQNHTEKVRQMVQRVRSFDYVVVGSEFEALVLECALIKQHNPKYNILLKDDKGYHYIRVSAPPYSRLSEAKQTAEDGAQYIGPYMSSYAIKQAVDEANKIYGLASCSRPLCYGKRSSERPCLNHHIGQCCAPCTGKIDPDAYQARVEEAVEFLTRGSARTLATLQQRMEEAAERLDFEQAARLRDRIKAIRRMSEKQKVILSRIEEQDVIALAQGSDRACFEVFRFTDGQLSDREHFLMEELENLPAARHEFLQRYYTLRERIPPQITIDGEVEDRELLEQWMTDKAGKRIRILQPQIGEQAHLIEMCRSNAAERIAQQVGMTGRDATALEEIRQLLDLSTTPAYIECYDISHTAGAEPVAAMVVFGAGVNGNVPSLSLRNRIDGAYNYLAANPDAICIVSGGQGTGENISEAECMFRELTKMGIGAERIWQEDQSTSTRENLKFSLDLIQQRTGIRPTEIGLLSSEYHLYRAGLFAQEQGVTAYGIPAETSWVSLRINYYLREIVAVWYYTLFGG